MSRELVVLVGLEFGQELRDSALHLGEAPRLFKKGAGYFVRGVPICIGSPL